MNNLVIKGVPLIAVRISDIVDGLNATVQVIIGKSRQELLAPFGQVGLFHVSYRSDPMVRRVRVFHAVSFRVNYCLTAIGGVVQDPSLMTTWIDDPAELAIESVIELRNCLPRSDRRLTRGVEEFDLFARSSVHRVEYKR